MQRAAGDFVMMYIESLYKISKITEFAMPFLCVEQLFLSPMQLLTIIVIISLFIQLVQ